MFVGTIGLDKERQTKRILGGANHSMQQQDNKTVQLAPMPPIEEKMMEKTAGSTIASPTKDATSLSAKRNDIEHAHALVNRERKQASRRRPPLRRSKELDQICQKHAEYMAQQGMLSHSANSLEELQKMVQSKEAGENIHRGNTVMQVHAEAMRQGSPSQRNILGKNIVEFGVGLARGPEDGKLYMVQLFRGETNSNRASSAKKRQSSSFGNIVLLLVILCAVSGGCYVLARNTSFPFLFANAEYAEQEEVQTTPFARSRGAGVASTHHRRRLRSAKARRTG